MDDTQKNLRAIATWTLITFGVWVVLYLTSHNEAADALRYLVIIQAVILSIATLVAPRKRN